MSESQSRYSIVERLTSSKLGLIDSKNKIQKDIEDLKQSINEMISGISQYKVDVQEDVKRNIREKEKDVERFRSKLSFLENQKENNLKDIAEKISQLDKALTSIEEISKTAPAPEQNQ